MEIKKVLLPIDGSERSKRTVRMVKRVCRPEECEIYIVKVIGAQLYINSINGRDYSLFMLLTIFYTSIGLLASIVVDISYGFIDPRIRMGSKK